MAIHEWDGEQFVEREPGRSSEQPRGPIMWQNEVSPEEWRKIFLMVLEEVDHDPLPHEETCQCNKCECLKASVASFADAINIGFYVNSYTTKQCPTMEGVLEN